MSDLNLPAENLQSKPGDARDATAHTAGQAAGGMIEPFLNQAVPGKKAPTNEWTVVTDLAILFDQQSPQGHLGAEDKLRMLEQLKDKTKGKPVTIVIEALTSDATDLTTINTAQNKHPYGSELIVLHDGQETVIHSGPSKQLKGDLQDALDYALANAPSSKVALAINAHGLGDQGILGGMQEQPYRTNGMLTADELAYSIKTSLAKAGREKLDVVDLDSCLMAEMGVLRSMNGVTSQLVASEKTELVGLQPSKIDGQDLNSWISKIIETPSMTGFDVGQEMVHQADRNVNGYGDHQGTETIAHFDLAAHFDDFNGSMDVLGKALSDASTTPANREQINAAIDRVTDVASSDRSPALSSLTAKRDMAGFLEALKLKMKTGSLSDADHHINQAISGVEKNLGSMEAAAHLPETQSFASPLIKTRNLAGLSLFLPNEDVRSSAWIPQKRIDDIEKMETGTTDGDWAKFLSGLRHPRAVLGVVTR